MWFFTKEGFFSVVQKENESDLTIRARVKKDLIRLKNIIPTLSNIEEHTGSDYPFRVKVTHDDFALGMARISLSINYPNFKDMCHYIFGNARAVLYTKIWGILYNMKN